MKKKEEFGKPLYKQICKHCKTRFMVYRMGKAICPKCDYLNVNTFPRNLLSSIGSEEVEII